MLMLTLMVLFLYTFDDELTLKNLLSYAPSNYYLAAIFIIFMYALKSLSVLFPISLLYILSGIIFKPIPALLVNILGMAVATTLPYWIGRFSGADMVDHIKNKYKRAKVLDNFKEDNEVFFSFIVRAIGFLPCDIVSLLMGLIKLNYKKYIIGTILGMLPGLISVTFVGQTIANPKSWQFIVSCASAVIISASTTLIYIKIKKNNKDHGK